MALPAAIFPSLFVWAKWLSSAGAAGMIFLEGILFLCLLVGLFTRVASGIFLALICIGLPGFHATADWNAWNASIALAVICLALISLGGGRFSLDRGISRQILPEIG